MNEPWKAAAELMRDYFESEGETWPAFEASTLTKKIKIDQDHHWTDRRFASETDAVLRRALFDVDHLAECFLGVEFSIENLAFLDQFAGAPVYGFARPEDRAITICERTLEYEPLYRATVMHEVGHLVLHSTPSQRVLAFSPGARSRPPEERDADQFMHVSLLPKSVLLLGVARIADMWGISIRDALGNANTQRGRWQWKNRFLASLINTLGVSREMICVKMRSLGFFTVSTLDYHRTYHLPNRWLSKANDKPLRAPIQRLLKSLEIEGDWLDFEPTAQI